METVKSCQNCAMGKIHYPNNTCEVCTSTELSMWQPNEQTKTEYMNKIIDGSNGTTEYDVVSKPKHYMLFETEGIEVRDVIEQLVDKVQSVDIDIEPPRTPWHRSNPLFVSDYVQLMQYLMRFMDKNGVEDLKKARVYLNWMIEAYE